MICELATQCHVTEDYSWQHPMLTSILFYDNAFPVYLLPKKAVQKLRLIFGTRRHRPNIFISRKIKVLPLLFQKTCHKEDNYDISDHKIALAYQLNIRRTQRPYVSVIFTQVWTEMTQESTDDLIRPQARLLTPTMSPSHTCHHYRDEWNSNP